MMSFIGIDPHWDVVRSEPRFRELLRKLNPANPVAVTRQTVLDYYWDAGSLKQMGDDGLSKLIQILESNAKLDSDFERHQKALTAIDRLRPEPGKLVPVLLDHLERGILAESSAITLARVAGPDAVPPLLKALQNPSAEVRAAAAWVLADFHPDSNGRLKLALDGDERTWDNFGSVAKAVTPALVKGLKDDDAKVRHRAAYTLGNIGGEAKSAVPALLQTMSDSNALVREHAASALGQLGVKDEAVLSALKQALADPIRFVRDAAAASLKQLQGPPPRNPL